MFILWSGQGAEVEGRDFAAEKDILLFFSVSCVLRIFNSSRREQINKPQMEPPPLSVKTSSA